MGKAPVTIEAAKKPITPFAGKLPAKSPNSDRYRKPTTEDISLSETQVTAPLDPVEIIDKSTIKLNREIYSRKGFNQTVGIDFEEFSKKEDTFSVTQFFQLYNALFFDIPRIGVESHNTIKRRSSEFIRGFSADNDPKDNTIDNLNDKILELEQQLLLANQTDPEHPFFRNGSLLTTDPSTHTAFYYMDKGFKRKIATRSLLDDLVIILYGTSTPVSDKLVPVVSTTIISQIKTGPNLTEGNLEQNTFIENGELYVGENVNDDTKDARINSLSNEVKDLKEDIIDSEDEISTLNETIETLQNNLNIAEQKIEDFESNDDLDFSGYNGMF